MPERMEFDVIGLPATQGSKVPRVIEREGRKPVAVLHEATGEKLKLWRSAVAEKAQREMERQQFATVSRGIAVYLAVLFLLPRPMRPLNELPVVRPDLDKLTRAICDALTTAGAYHDDAQVTDLVARKRYTTDYVGARIAVTAHWL